MTFTQHKRINLDDGLESDNVRLARRDAKLESCFVVGKSFVELVELFFGVRTTHKTFGVALVNAQRTVTVAHSLDRNKSQTRKKETKKDRKKTIEKRRSTSNLHNTKFQATRKPLTKVRQKHQSKMRSFLKKNNKKTVQRHLTNKENKIKQSNQHK